MPGSITLLPIMLEEQEARDALPKVQPPKTLVCRYGYMKLIAELPYDGGAQVGCGSKLVIRTPRGIELAEMLTSTCANAGCGKSVSRKEMLQYIEASGGKDFPFTSHGKVLRVATLDDINEQAGLDHNKQKIIQWGAALVRELDLPMRFVEVERLLGGERMIFHYTSEQWVDFRELVRQMASEFQTRIEMHQVNARDEARLTADYEKCGQHCCCKQFLKVLKPVSMRSAKVQKATLDPAKISGRCGRLMCCLRYEDQTYESLRKRLPHKQTRVMTTDGPGTVIDTQILTQLVRVRLDHTDSFGAFPVEDIQKLSKQEDALLREQAKEAAEAAAQRGRYRQAPSKQAAKPTVRTSATDRQPQAPTAGAPQATGDPTSDAVSTGSGQGTPGSPPPVQDTDQTASGPRKRRRRRRRGRGNRGKNPGNSGSGPASGQP